FYQPAEPEFARGQGVQLRGVFHHHPRPDDGYADRSGRGGLEEHRGSAGRVREGAGEVFQWRLHRRGADSSQGGTDRPASEPAGDKRCRGGSDELVGPKPAAARLILDLALSDGAALQGVRGAGDTKVRGAAAVAGGGGWADSGGPGSDSTIGFGSGGLSALNKLHSYTALLILMREPQDESANRPND